MSKIDRRSFLRAAGTNIGALGFLGTTRPSRAPHTQSEVLEVAVIRAGAFGGWTALYLSEMGVSVTLIDAYGPGNARSSSAGETRQIRAAYGERELYSRWAIEALDRWKARQAEWGKKLLFETGQITFGSDWSSVRTTKTVLDGLGVENEILSKDEWSRRFPQFDAGGGGSVRATGRSFPSRQGASRSEGRRTTSGDFALDRRYHLGPKLRVRVWAVAPQNVSGNSRRQAPLEPAHDFFHGNPRGRPPAFVPELSDVQRAWRVRLSGH